jgi:hypothetical protein
LLAHLLALSRDGPAGAVTFYTGSIAQLPSFEAGTVRGHLSVQFE